jgi:hypothetical protein
MNKNPLSCFEIYYMAFVFLYYFFQDFFGKVKNGHFKNVQNWKTENSFEICNI